MKYAKRREEVITLVFLYILIIVANHFCLKKIANIFNNVKMK